MSELVITIEQLRGMIGVKLCHNNQPCQVVEVLENGPSLVLQYFENNIQNNQYGDAHRRAPETLCIPVLSEDKKELHNMFLMLNLI